MSCSPAQSGAHTAILSAFYLLSSKRARSGRRFVHLLFCYRSWRAAATLLETKLIIVDALAGLAHSYSSPHDDHHLTTKSLYAPGILFHFCLFSFRGAFCCNVCARVPYPVVEPRLSAFDAPASV